MVNLGAIASRDSEKSHALFLAWDELGPMLAYAPEDAEWQAVLAMRELFCALYTNPPTTMDLESAAVAWKYREPCRKANSQSNYLTQALVNTAGMGHPWHTLEDPILI